MHYHIIGICLCYIHMFKFMQMMHGMTLGIDSRSSVAKSHCSFEINVLDELITLDPMTFLWMKLGGGIYIFCVSAKDH